MKIIFLILVCLMSLSLSAETNKTISQQFYNRNWHYHSAINARFAHLIDYFNADVLKDSITHIKKFISTLDSQDEETLNLFYPEVGILSQDARISLKDDFSKTLNGYEVLLKWEDFLEAIGTERWEDSEGCLATQPMGNLHCGRRTKGNFAVSNFTNSQRLGIDELKLAVFNDLELIEKYQGSFPSDSGTARVFQFLHDSRSLHRLIQTSYLKAYDPLDPDLRRKNIIELGRALIIQAFQGRDGRLINTDLFEIDLENENCFSLPEEEQYPCQLSYIREMVWDYDYSSSELVSNLILDPKAVKPVMDSLIEKFREENPEAVTKAQLEEFLKKAYLSLCLAYDLNPMDPEIPLIFQLNFIEHVKLSMDYLINKRDIIGLQVSRSLQELVIYLEGLNENK